MARMILVPIRALRVIRGSPLLVAANGRAMLSAVSHFRFSNTLAHAFSYGLSKKIAPVTRLPCSRERLSLPLKWTYLVHFPPPPEKNLRRGPKAEITSSKRVKRRVVYIDIVIAKIPSTTFLHHHDLFA